MQAPRLLVLLLSLVFACAVPARAADLFTVQGVAVDATAANTTEARTQALARGQRDAALAMIRRLAPRDALRGAPALNDARVAALVQGLEIAEERSSATRYLGRINVSFRPAAVRAWLRENGIPYSETASRPLVVLPVYGEGEAATLWLTPNPWREAWAANLHVDSLLPIIVPLGDLEDVTAITAEQALKGEPGPLQAIAARYGASPLVVQAVPGADGRSVVVTATTFRDGAPVPAVGDSLPAASQEAVGLAEAVHEVQARLEDQWKLATLLEFSTSTAVDAVAPLAGLADLVFIRERLAGVPEIERVDLVALDRTAARFQLRVFGDTGRLATALAARDLALENRDGVWELRRRGGAAAARP